MKYLIVCINKRYYRLYQYNNIMWRLFYQRDRETVGIQEAHSLDYWRGKGVIEGEEENQR